MGYVGRLYGTKQTLQKEKIQHSILITIRQSIDLSHPQPNPNRPVLFIVVNYHHDSINPSRICYQHISLLTVMLHCASILCNKF